MTRVRRDDPHISPVQLAGLLAGDAHCQWASWFRAHHEDWERRPILSVSYVDCRSDYTFRLISCIRRFEQEGYKVSNGGPNSYLFRIGGLVLSGRPDVIAIKGDDCVVIDFPRVNPEFDPIHSHEFQVMMHMYALPQSMERLRDMAPRGQLEFWEGLVDIPASTVDREFIERLHGLAERLASGGVPARVPSPRECGACDITEADCPERMDGGVPENFRLPDPPGHEAFLQMLERAEWAEGDRDREHEARTRAEARIRELEEDIRRLGSL